MLTITERTISGARRMPVRVVEEPGASEQLCGGTATTLHPQRGSAATELFFAPSALPCVLARTTNRDPQEFQAKARIKSEGAKEIANL